MCGIFGVATTNKNVEPSTLVNLTKDLLLRSESRGKESSGLAYKFSGDEVIAVHKQALSASEFIKDISTKNFLHVFDTRLSSKLPCSIIGHARMVTNGHQDVNDNNQPVVKNGFAIVHNGIFCNVEDLYKQNNGFHRRTDVDTEIMCDLLNADQNKGIHERIKDAFGLLEGSASLGILNERSSSLIVASNIGSLYYWFNEVLGLFVFASEEFILKSTLSEVLKIDNPVVVQLKVNSALDFNLDLAKVEFFSVDKFTIKSKKNYELSPVKFNNYGVLEYPIEEVRKLRRCTKCILPETFPFIEFNESGVCNYCLRYKPKKNIDQNDKILSLIKPLKTPKSHYDCLVPFSGGRDSSYGMHYLVKELGLKPLSYTYDWGMVTDLARRNISRMCSQLGVENILISADIKHKRENIKKNVTAWLKKPEMGMVPLFMAGDKSFLTFVNQIKKQTGIQVDIWMPNWLENTDFKTGYCGIRPSDKRKRIDALPFASKLHLAAYYGVNFLTNPSYLNTSIIDTLKAYFAYYFEPRVHYYVLYDFVSWDENKINEILVGDYNWETAPDTSSTWRIGDGTAGFYNYIYYTLGGFTEVDTFRSNQVREGMISREAAIKLAEIENQPRYENILWYLQTIGLDFKDTIKMINNFKRAYRE